MAHSVPIDNANQYNFITEHNHNHENNNNDLNPFNNLMHGNNENSVKLEHSPIIKNEVHEHNDTKIRDIAEKFVSFHDEENEIFGCKHYARNCFLKAQCCGIWYVCRFCHDERNEYIDHGNTNNGSCSSSAYDHNLKPHQINRYATEYVKCMRCGTEQQASKYCNSCTIEYDEYGQEIHPKSVKQEIVKQEMKNADDDNNDPNFDNNHDNDNDVDMNHINNNINIKREKKRKLPATSQPYELGRYYCDICKFYDDEQKEIFHCLECGLCRLGNRTDYIHCQRCGCCLNYKYYAKHPCIENSLKSDCPICFTYLFKSREPVTFFMPCGHPIHYECLMQYTKIGNWKCPICRAGWYDEESEKRKKIVEAIKSMQQRLYQHDQNNDNNDNDTQ